MKVYVVLSRDFPRIEWEALCPEMYIVYAFCQFKQANIKNPIFKQSDKVRIFLLT